jgi:hypothetical protein
MLKCPMCEKNVPEHEKTCGKCGTDVSLLVNYIDDLREGLDQARALTRRGELADAVWKYLEVLEVDPDNTEARRQVGRVATAVRQFDEKAPGRRWFKKLEKRNRWRRWLNSLGGDGEGTAWITTSLWIMLVVAALCFGYVMGTQPTKPDDKDKDKDKPAALEPNKKKDKD